MTWTYSTSFLSAVSSITANLMRVRLLVGDTDTSRQQLQDEEIYWPLSSIEGLNYAAATVAEILASKYAFQVNTENSELRISAAARHKQYMALADRLRAGGPGSLPGIDGGVPLGAVYVGGAVQADVDALSDNDSYREPSFAVGMDDLPGTQTDSDGFGD